MNGVRTRTAVRDDATLRRTWVSPSGLIGWLRTTDHKSIALRFIGTAFVFFIIGGVEALLMRTQLAQSQAGFLSPEAYNQIFTMHGSTMMFFFALPVLEGMAIYLVPLMIGARENAFPRLNAFAYWVYLAAGLLLYWGFFTGAAPDQGWFSYVPLALKEFSPSSGVDYWTLSISMLEVSALTQAVTLVVTILKMRAPGMTLGRMPLFVWATLVFSLMVVFAMPALILTSIMLELDRTALTRFFDAAAGGDPLLWQHLFWWFGHPDVYIIFLPATGFISMIVPTFSRRAIVGYPFVALAIAATGFISFAVWGHHMFATGIPRLQLAYFAGASMVVAIPTGIQIFSWLATMWSSHRIVLRTSLLFIIGFFLIFVIGGLTGVMLASVPFDEQVHDTFFVVAHLHYVLIGGMVFPLMGAFYYWFPKFTGRMLSERLGVWHVILAFIGFNLAFFPMHNLGFRGMPRRVYTYLPDLGWDGLNFLATVGAFIFAASAAVFLVNVARTLRRGREAEGDPWKANTLEWATASPPAVYNFRTIPSVRSRDPVWAQPEFAGGGDQGFADAEHEEEDRVLLELRDDRMETPVTSVLEGEPQGRVVVSGASIWPLMAALAVTIAFGGMLGTLWAVPAGLLLLAVTLVFWHWPQETGSGGPVVPESAPAAATRVEGREQRPTRQVPLEALPDNLTGPRAPPWWGSVVFLAISATLYAMLISSYFYLRHHALEWPIGDVGAPELVLPTVGTALLLASGLFMHLGGRWFEKGSVTGLLVGKAVALILGAGFLALKATELADLPFAWSTDAYGSIVWALLGFHLVHVLVTIFQGIHVFWLARRGHFTRERRLGIDVHVMHWHFVVLMWLPIYLTVYLAPRFLG